MWSNESAKRYPLIEKIFNDFGFPISINTSIIPDDDTTLFVCSGMQNLKPLFHHPTDDNGVCHRSFGTLQSCIRTNDLELVGDGTHLTYFEMLGNFSFGRTEYLTSIDMWVTILREFGLIKDCVIHTHPEACHHLFWKHLGFPVVKDLECQWSDGDIGGYCSEVYWRGIEIGNLVNTLGDMTDVGFGWERLLSSIEGKTRVDETNIFNQELDPITRDHVRTVDCLWDNGIEPGNKGRHYICRKIIRKILTNNLKVKWTDWLEQERTLREKCLKNGRKLWKKHKDKTAQWWWETCGIMGEELKFIG